MGSFLFGNRVEPTSGLCVTDQVGGFRCIWRYTTILQETFADYSYSYDVGLFPVGLMICYLFISVRFSENFVILPKPMLEIFGGCSDCGFMVFFCSFKPSLL